MWACASRLPRRRHAPARRRPRPLFRRRPTASVQTSLEHANAARWDHRRGPRSGGGCVETATSMPAGGVPTLRAGRPVAARGRRGRGWHTATVTEAVVWVLPRHGYRSRHSSDRRRRDPDVRRARHGGRSRSACGRLGSDAHRRGRAGTVLRVLEPASGHAPRHGATLGLRRHSSTDANTASLAPHIPAGHRPTGCRRSTSPRRRQCASRW